MRVGLFAESGKVVQESDAFQYALNRIANGTQEEQQEFVEWFYSGNWIEEEPDERNI